MGLQVILIDLRTGADLKDYRVCSPQFMNKEYEDRRGSV